MPYVLDAVIAAIVIICVVRGAKKGFIRAAFGIVTFLLAAVLAFMFLWPVFGLCNYDAGGTNSGAEFIRFNL